MGSIRDAFKAEAQFQIREQEAGAKRMRLSSLAKDLAPYVAEELKKLDTEETQGASK